MPARLSICKVRAKLGDCRIPQRRTSLHRDPGASIAERERLAPVEFFTPSWRCLAVQERRCAARIFRHFLSANRGFAERI